MTEQKRFSRRHRTAEAHIVAQSVRMEKEKEWRNTMARNAAERASRTPFQQLALLDKRLGKGMGAKKERKRLLAQMEKKNVKKG